MTGYLHRLQAAIDRGEFTPSPVTHVHVDHASTCRQKPCTCTPTITVLTATEALTIGQEGDVTDRSPRQ